VGKVVYQVYVRSFADANGDGHGDLAGVRSKLDYLSWLGVDAVWLSPTYPSPNVDWGYDVADYLGVHPDYGTLEDLDALIADAHARGLELWLDLVPNHTSNEHRWFEEQPDYYVWSDAVPNDWTSIFTGKSAWTYDEARRSFYLHQFAPEQPDLDWWNPALREEFERILRFWFDRGVNGLRIDVAHALIKDRALRDGVAHMRDRPEVLEIYANWQEIARAYDPKPTLMGETYVPLSHVFRYASQLDLVQNFDFLRSRLRAEELRPIVEHVEALLPADRSPLWFGSNHDHSRLATRWASGDERRARAALFVLLTLRGTVLLYQGDELALTDGAVPRDRITDLADPPRDPERTPMPWTAGGEEWRDPWLPLANTTRNVETQRSDPESTLAFVRGLIEWRREIGDAPYATLASEPGVWAYARGDATCVVNLTDREARHDGRRLRPWETIIY
jgi:alpha-glucosidase